MIDSGCESERSLRHLGSVFRSSVYRFAAVLFEVGDEIFRNPDVHFGSNRLFDSSLANTVLGIDIAASVESLDGAGTLLRSPYRIRDSKGSEWKVLAEIAVLLMYYE